MKWLRKLFSRDKPDNPIFEVYDPKEKKSYKIYEDGRIEGFPDGVYVLNRITPILNKYRSYIEVLK